MYLAWRYNSRERDIFRIGDVINGRTQVSPITEKNDFLKIKQKEKRFGVSTDTPFDIVEL